MLEKKIAVVTGGTRGIGKAISLKLAKQGYIVCAACHSNEVLANETLTELQKINPDCNIFKADLSKQASATELIDKISSLHGRIDILVNNAGIFDFKFIDEMDDEYFDYVFVNNFKSQFYLLQAVIPHMKKNHFGRIINASSISGRLPDVGLLAYGASKASVDIMTKIASAELAPHGITVNAFAPGIIHTAMTSDMIAERGEIQVKNISAARFGTGDDVASLVGFLVSEEASYITGEIIGVDGGMFKVQNAFRAYEHANEQ